MVKGAMFYWVGAAALLFGAATLASGCPREEAETTSAETASAAATTAAAGAVTTAGEGVDAPPLITPDLPTPKAFAFTSAGTLGTLPEGVGLAVGSAAPGFTAADQEGGSRSLAGLLNALPADGAVALIFYRGGWCPYCNAQVRQISNAASALKAIDVQPVMISVDVIDGAAKASSAYDVDFPLLSDPEATVHRAYHVVNAMDAAAVKRLHGFGIDIEKWSGKDHHIVAIPSVFLINKAGKLLWAHAEHNYQSRPETNGLLAAFKQALAK